MNTVYYIKWEPDLTTYISVLTIGDIINNLNQITRRESDLGHAVTLTKGNSLHTSHGTISDTRIISIAMFLTWLKYIISTSAKTAIMSHSQGETGILKFLLYCYLYLHTSRDSVPAFCVLFSFIKSTSPYGRKNMSFV